MKSNKLILSFLILLLSAVAALGQTTSKEINAIKRNTAYLYAEATMNSASEARSVADELLMQQIQEYIGSKRKLDRADNVLIKNINSKTEVLNMMRGTMHRVFVYVKKSDIEGVANTTVVNSASGTTVTVGGGEGTLVDLRATPDNGQQSAVSSQQSTGTQVSHLRSADSGQQAVASPLTGWQQQAMQTLLTCKDITAIRASLNRMKSEYKVKRYGTPDKCTSPADAFWVVYDNAGVVIAILGPGQGKRIEYRSMQYSKLENYNAMGSLWFTFAK